MQLQGSLFQLDIHQTLIRLTKSHLCNSYISTNTAVATCIDFMKAFGALYLQDKSSLQPQPGEVAHRGARHRQDTHPRGGKV